MKSTTATTTTTNTTIITATPTTTTLLLLLLRLLLPTNLEETVLTAVATWWRRETRCLHRRMRRGGQGQGACAHADDKGGRVQDGRELCYGEQVFLTSWTCMLATHVRVLSKLRCAGKVC